MRQSTVLAFLLLGAWALQSTAAAQALQGADDTLATNAASGAGLPDGTPVGPAYVPTRVAFQTLVPPVPQERPVALTGSLSALSDIRTLTANEADSGRVCESRERPGSRMTRRVCYTAQEWDSIRAAREEALKDELEEFKRQQKWRDEEFRQAQMEQRRPSGFGFGP